MSEEIPEDPSIIRHIGERMSWGGIDSREFTYMSHLAGMTVLNKKIVPNKKHITVVGYTDYCGSMYLPIKHSLDVKNLIEAVDHVAKHGGSVTLSHLQELNMQQPKWRAALEVFIFSIFMAKWRICVYDSEGQNVYVVWDKNRRKESRRTHYPRNFDPVDKSE